MLKVGRTVILFPAAFFEERGKIAIFVRDKTVASIVLALQDMNGGWGLKKGMK